MSSAASGRPRSLRRLAGGAVALGVAASALVVAPAVTAPSPAAAATRCSSTPFRSDPARKTWFRIPAAVRTAAGTLVAFAERRDTMTSDDGNFDIVTTRSTDQGCTWSPYRIVGSDAANRVSNPAPIVDRTTGAILLFSVVTQRPGGGGRGKGLYLQTSTDDGRTFTPLLQRPIRPGGTYKGGLTGPGHGVQLSVTHPGRLVVAMGYKTSTGRYGAYGIYSDDHGATWRTGFDEPDTTGRVQLIEGTVAELPSGELFITFRDKADGVAVGSARRYAISTDGGAGLAAPFKRLPLNVVSVQGSALALKGTYANHLLFSSPGLANPDLRRQMSVFVSTTKGATWGRRYQVELEDTPGSYSDLVQLGPSTIGILYETGTVTWKERIAWQTIAVPSLTSPAPVASSLTFKRSASPTRTAAQAAVTVTVRVGGISSPPGRVTLAYAGAGRSGRVCVDFTYSNRGLRVIRLPRLPRGDYRLTLTYSGTGRIKPATTPAGTLRVVP